MAWLDEHLISLEDLPEAPHVHESDHATVLKRQQAFGYTFEVLRKVLEPMAEEWRRSDWFHG